MVEVHRLERQLSTAVSAEEARQATMVAIAAPVAAYRGNNNMFAPMLIATALNIMASI